MGNESPFLGGRGTPSRDPSFETSSDVFFPTLLAAERNRLNLPIEEAVLSAALDQVRSEIWECSKDETFCRQQAAIGNVLWPAYTAFLVMGLNPSLDGSARSCFGEFLTVFEWSKRALLGRLTAGQHLSQDSVKPVCPGILMSPSHRKGRSARDDGGHTDVPRGTKQQTAVHQRDPASMTAQPRRDMAWRSAEPALRCLDYVPNGEAIKPRMPVPRIVARSQLELLEETNHINGTQVPGQDLDALFPGLFRGEFATFHSVHLRKPRYGIGHSDAQHR